MTPQNRPTARYTKIAPIFSFSSGPDKNDDDRNGLQVENLLFQNPIETQNQHGECTSAGSKPSSLTLLSSFLIYVVDCITKCLASIFSKSTARCRAGPPGACPGNQQPTTTTVLHQQEDQNATHDPVDLEKQDRDQSYDSCLDSPKVEKAEDEKYCEQGEEGLVTATSSPHRHQDGNDEDDDDPNNVRSIGDDAEDDGTTDDVAEDNDDDTSTTTSTDNSTASEKSNTDTIHVWRKPMVDHSSGKKGVYTGTIGKSTGMPHGQGRLEFIKERRLQQDGDCIHENQPSMGYQQRLSHGDEERFDEGFNGGLKHETGVMDFTKGQFFEGEYKHGKKIKGKMTSHDGSVIEGSCVSDCMQHGPQCQRVVPAERSIYEGEFRYGSFHGHGKLTWNDGGWYVGEWRHGKMHGHGKEHRQYESLAHNDREWSKGRQPIDSSEITGSVFASFPLMRGDSYICVNGKTIFTQDATAKPPKGTRGSDVPRESDLSGYELEDEPHVDISTDTLFVVDKNILDPYGEKGVYTGALSKSTGVPNGKGRLEYEKEGRWYEGDWIHGRWTGYGRLSNGDGDFYEGGLKNDHKHGTGVTRFADGRVFEGEYHRGQMMQGKMTYHDGSVYGGSWFDGMSHGRGKCIFVDGSEYEGEFREGNFHGHGHMTWNDGGWYVGEWSGGERHGRGKEIRADGSLRHEGEWSRGQPIQSSNISRRHCQQLQLVDDVEGEDSHVKDDYEHDDDHVHSNDYDEASNIVTTLSEEETEDSDNESSTASTHSSSALEKSNNNTCFVVRKHMIDQYGGKGVYTGSMSKSTRMPHGKGYLEFVKEGLLQQGADCIQQGQKATRHRRLSKVDGDLYEGEFKNDLKHGTGVMQFADGRVFEGEYQYGKMIKGKMTYHDGSVNEGSFVDDCLRHGIPDQSVAAQAERSMYEGEFRNGSFHGHGKLTWNDGGWYDGDWCHGQMHGRGREIRAEGTCGPDREWSRGQRTPYSTCTGSIFRQSEQNRTAANDPDDISLVTDEHIVDPFGEKGVYTGALSKSTGMPNGKGRLEYEKEGRWYEGDWIHGRWTGYGRLANGDGDFYEGGLKDDYKHGTGVMRFADGRVFQGEYNREQMLQGKMIYQDGSIYVGAWVDSMHHGRGIYFFADGSKYEGEFRKGSFHGHGKMTWSNGGWYIGEWRDGEEYGLGFRDPLSMAWCEGKPFRLSGTSLVTPPLSPCERRITMRGLPTKPSLDDYKYFT